MKLSEATVNVLKNFSSINTGLVFKQGNVLRTMSKQQNVLAKATIPESFDQDFTIYDLRSVLVFDQYSWLT
jgi:ABC-type lipoprotein export system ATPase subunit